MPLTGPRTIISAHIPRPAHNRARFQIGAGAWWLDTTEPETEQREDNILLRKHAAEKPADPIELDVYGGGIGETEQPTPIAP